MANQDNIITMTVPTTAVRGNLVSGAGTFSATLKAVGIVLDDADGETEGAVRISGTMLVKLGATLTAGALIVMNASGVAIAHVEDTETVDGTDHLVCGVLLEGGVADELRDAIIK